MRLFKSITIGVLMVAIVASIASLSQASSSSSSSSTVEPSTGKAVAGVLSPLSDRRVATGWIPWWQLSEGVASVVDHPQLFSEAAVHWYRVTRSSTVVKLESGVPDETALIDGVNSLHAAGVRVLVSATDVGMDSNSMARVLEDPSRRSALISSLVATVNRTGADGVDLDFEAMNFPAGPQRAVISRKFPIFLKGLQTSLHRSGHLLSLSVPARTSDQDSNWSIYDYSDFAPYIDRARVLTYDHSFFDTAPGPVAPIDWVDQITRYAKSEFRGVPLSLGLPGYGYNWYIKKLSGTCTDAMGVKSTQPPTAQQALALVDSYNADLKWDKQSAESFFTYRRPYTDGGAHCVVLRKVWFEAARSAAAKLSILRQRHVQGFSVWALGTEDPRTWNVLHRYAAKLNPGPAAARLDAPNSISAGSNVSLVGRFRVGGLPVQSEDVTVQRRVRGGEWSSVGTVTTNAFGRATFDAAPSRTLEWRMRLPAAWDWANTFSPLQRVVVQ
ncbi:MAG TPA: glycosyl hydrolase family 18 protein [Actinomycetes bacterium]|nr:glycosyl hydrolase family 18 protein [Actinomycetes bacterium]